MASKKDLSSIPAENHHDNNTSPSRVESESLIDQDSLTKRSFNASFAPQDAQNTASIHADSTRVGWSPAETKAEDKVEEIKTENVYGGNDQSDVDPDSNLSDRDDADGRIARWESYGVPSTEARSLEKRREVAALRLQQSKAYAELIEDRILDLEKKVRGLRKEKTPPPEERLTSFPSNKVDIAYQDWAQFSARHPFVTEDGPPWKRTTWKHCPEVDTEPKHIIEILQEAPFPHNPNTAKTHGPSDLARTETLNSNPTSGEGAAYPYLIRIRSRLLLRIIQEATECDTVVGPHKHRLLLFRPYKLFVKHAEVLRNFLLNLEKENSGNANKEPLLQTPDLNGRSRVAVASSPAAEGPPPETHTEQARDELRLLLQVVETHLSREIKLYTSLSPTTGRVRFVDLWYIFRPGYEIRSPGASQIQLYRVILVSGGRDIMGMEYSTEGKILASEKLKNSGYSKGSFIIEAFYIGFDGNRFGPVNKTFQIRKFDGEKDITTLPVYPLSCDPNYKTTREALVSRGQAFADLSKPNINAHRKYKGLTLDPNRQEHVESEVIVDFQLAFTAVDVEKPTISSSSLEGLIDDMFNELDEPHKPYQLPCLDFGCCGNDIVYRDYEIDETERNRFRQQNEGLLDSCEDPETLTDSHKALLPPQAHGFVLRTRKWATLDIDLLDPPVYDGGWQNLVIDEDIKSMVLALVENHERPHGSQLTIDNALPSVDLVQGKGRGLIILLHGEPGVGKTSTAECVASHTKRPLFPITCGDIGEKATDVEDHLEKNFQLAHKWGCVLLLDEADVFLGKRGTNDIQRNAIVSVFLRTLEYYSGILFLTTNRVGKIDRAFKSRIHISLFYSKLDLDRTVKIWENNLKRVREDVEKEGMKIRCRNEDIINFAKDHFRELESGGKDRRNRGSRKVRKVDLRVWNGRQIRNAFQTAIAIAKYEAKDRNQRQGRPSEPLSLDLSEKQFKQVATIAERFDQYLNELHGKNEADLARKDKTWVDSKDTEQEEDRRKTSRDRNRSGSKERQKRRKRQWSETSDDTESSYVSDDFEHRPHKRTDRRERRK